MTTLYERIRKTSKEVLKRLKKMGFNSIPHRTTIDRWKKIVRQRIKRNNLFIRRYLFRLERFRMDYNRLYTNSR